MKFGNIVRVETYDIDEDQTPQKQSSCSQACGFATITMYTQGPFWLLWRIALVGRENRIEAMKKLPDVRFLFSSLTTPPFMAAKTRIQRCLCREVGGIWQCCMGRNLMTFDKDHGTAEEGLQKQSSCSQAYGFATITIYKGVTSMPQTPPLLV